MRYFIIIYFVLFFCSKGKAQTTTYSVLSTAYDRSTGTFFSLGSIDNSWFYTKIEDLVVPNNPASVINYPNDPTYVVANAGNNTYPGIIANHSINMAPNTNSLGLKLFTYRTYFTLPNLLTTSNRYSLAFKMSADDAVYEVKLNGTQKAQFLSSTYNNIPGINKPYMLNVPICDTDLVSGLNYIDVVVADAGGSVGYYAEVILYEVVNPSNTQMSIVSSCNGGSPSAVASITTSVSNPTVSYYWTDSNGILVSQTTGTSALSNTVTNLANGTYTVQSQVNGSCGSIITQTLNINCVVTPTQTCGGSLEFNNNSDAVYLPLNNQMYSINGFTWECWFKLNTTFGSIPRTLIANVDPVVYEDIFLGFGWNLGTGNFPINHLGFKVDGPNATTGPTNVSCDYAPPGGFVLGTWYHAAGVMDYSTNTAKLYLNGLLVDTKTVMSDPFTRIIPGQLSYDGGIALGGNMDEVRIWKKVRTASEIFADYNHCLAGTELDLLSYYRCNQTSGATAVDGTPNVNNGILANTTSWSPQQPNLSGSSCASSVNFTVTPSPTICAGASTILSAVGATSYTWSNNVIASSITVSPSITTTYTVSGSNGICPTQTVVVVTVIPIPTLTLSPNTSICLGATPSTTLTASGAGSYSWNNASTLSSATGSAVVASPNTTTTYTVTGIISSCSNTAAVTVSVNPSPSITAVSFTNTSCGLNNGTVIVTSSPTNNTYTWSGGVASTTNSAGSLASGSYSITVSNGSCQTTTVVNVLSSVPLTITSTSITPSDCNLNNGSIVVTDNNTNSNYSWSPNVSSTNTAGNLPAGNYALTITNGACSTSTVLVVAQLNGPNSLNVMQSDAICESTNGSINIINIVGGTAPYQYNFNTTGYSSVTTYSDLAQGTYTITVKDAHGCFYTQTFLINKSTVNLTIDLITNAPTCNDKDGAYIISKVTAGTPPYLTSFNNGTYSGNLIFDHLGIGTYSLSIRDSNMCETPYVLTMQENGEYTLYIPNTFTPNNNIVNDIWYVKGTCLNSFYCTIYNRWGEKIKTLNDITEGWDGTYKGAPVPDGVYVYLIEVTTKDGTINKAGHITVFR